MSKARQALSLLNIFQMISHPETIYFISRSPYIRVAEFLNIFDNGMHNPFFLLFGRGYGGYFTDSLHLYYSGIDLGYGDYAAENILLGKFARPHSVYPSALLANGLIGLLLLLSMGIKYLKRIKKNFLSFAAFLLFFNSFYFNPQVALTFTFILFSSEYNFKKNENIIH
jgi:hypothetical protein